MCEWVRLSSLVVKLIRSHSLKLPNDFNTLKTFLFNIDVCEAEKIIFLTSLTWNQTYYLLCGTFFLLDLYLFSGKTMVVALRETYINIDPRQKQREINEVQLHALYFHLLKYFHTLIKISNHKKPAKPGKSKPVSSRATCNPIGIFIQTWFEELILTLTDHCKNCWLGPRQNEFEKWRALCVSMGGVGVLLPLVVCKREWCANLGYVVDMLAWVTWQPGWRGWCASVDKAVDVLAWVAY